MEKRSFDPHPSARVAAPLQVACDKQLISQEFLDELNADYSPSRPPPQEHPPLRLPDYRDVTRRLQSLSSRGYACCRQYLGKAFR